MDSRIFRAVLLATPVAGLILSTLAIGSSQDPIPDTAPDWRLRDPLDGECMGWFAQTAGDLDGDGVDELIFGDPHHASDGGSTEGAAFVFYGSSAGLPGAGIPTMASLQDGTLWIDGNSDSQLMGTHVASIGDVNGDGAGDIAVRDGFGNVFLSFQFPHLGVDRTVIACDNPFEGGLTATSAGDVNADGYDDVLLHCGIHVGVMLGGASGLTACDPCLIIDSDWLFIDFAQPDGQRYGFPAGDVNGDGFDDIVFTANGSPTQALVFHGPLTGTASTEDADWSFDSGTFLKLGAGGDLNRDGYDDIAIQNTTGPGAAEVGQIHVMYGSAQGLKGCAGVCGEADSDWTALGIDRPEGSGDDLIYIGFPSIVGDFGGDGYADLVVTAQLDHDDPATPGEGTPAAGLFLGGVDGLPNCAGTTPPSCTIRDAAWLVGSDQTSPLQGSNVFSGPAGDVDGDNGLDLVVAFPNRLFGGEVLVFHGFEDLDGDGISPEGGDCDDGDPAKTPGAPEVLDGLDNQCPLDLECEDDPGSGLVDEISSSSDAWTTHPSAEMLCWPSMQGAFEYEVVASTAPGFEGPIDDAQCSEIRITSLLCLSGECCVEAGFVPQSGEMFYFLARAAAPLIGSYGADSGGPTPTERTPCPGNHVSNGDFEVGRCFGGFETVSAGGRIPIGGFPAEFPDEPWLSMGQVDLSCRNAMWLAGSGSRAVQLRNGGSIRQRLDVDSNQTVEVSFLHAGTNFLGGPTDLSVDVDLQGSGNFVEVQSFSYPEPPGGFDGSPGQWQSETVSFQTQGPPPTLRFRSGFGSSSDVLLDRVTVRVP